LTREIMFDVLKIDKSNITILSMKCIRKLLIYWPKIYRTKLITYKNTRFRRFKVEILD